MGDLPDNAIFIIVFLIIGAVRWFIEQAGKKNQPPEPEHWEEYDYEERADQVAPKRSSLEDLYDEARREILDRQNRNYPEPEVLREKLGGPASAPPPLPPTRKAVSKPQPSFVAVEATPYQLREVKRPVLSEAEKAALANFEQQNRELKTDKTVTTRSNKRIRELLSSPSAARDAIVLSEILGKPKGLS